MESFRKILMFLIPIIGFGLLNAQHSLNISEIENKLSQQPKYIVVELYTDWCGICAIQDKKIQKNEDLVSLLEKKFYYVKFNAESTESFVLNGHEFTNQNKIQEFAKAISPDLNAFPAWVIMNSDFEIIFQYNGLIEVEDLKAILLKLKDLN